MREIRRPPVRPRARDVIRQDERGSIYEEYKDRVGTIVTGTVVAVIGIALASVAVANFQKELVTGTITFLAAAIASVYLRGFPRLLPVLIGVVVGYVVAGLDQAAGGACASAASGCHVNTSGRCSTKRWSCTSQVVQAGAGYVGVIGRLRYGTGFAGSET